MAARKNITHAPRKSVKPKAQPKPVRQKAPPKPAPWTFDIDPELGSKIEQMALTRGVDATTLVRVALHNLVQKGGLLFPDSKIGFGKYSSETVDTVIRCDPGYVRWCLRAIDRFSLSDDCMELLDEAEERLLVDQGGRPQ